MKWLIVLLMITLAFAVPGISAAQVSAPPGALGPELPGKAYCNLFGVAPDGPANLTYILAVANITAFSGMPITVISYPFPFTSFNSKTIMFKPHEQQFLGPADIACSNATCEVVVCSFQFGSLFQHNSLLFLMNKQTGEIINVISPTIFSTP